VGLKAVRKLPQTELRKAGRFATMGWRPLSFAAPNENPLRQAPGAYRRGHPTPSKSRFIS
jgi:hypothetical protein